MLYICVTNTHLYTRMACRYQNIIQLEDSILSFRVINTKSTEVFHVIYSAIFNDIIWSAEMDLKSLLAIETLAEMPADGLAL